MSPFKELNLKKISRGRKPIFKLAPRQRLRILNLLRQNDKKDHNIQSNNPVIDTANESHINVAPHINVSEYQYSLDQISHVSEHDSFKESLAIAFIQGNLTHTQGNIILKTLRSLPCLSYLPKDSRTLLNTPRKGPIISKVDPGEYLHIGFAKALIRILQKTPPNLIPDIIKIDWSTDGARLNKSGNMQIWPIQCSVANIANSKPEVVGIYKGPKKPQNINVFLDQFINDVLEVIDSGGISFLKKKLPVELRAFIADTPARSWIMNHFGHTSSNPCSKCRVVGTRCEDQMVFMGINHRLRTDDEYSKLDDEDHHKGPSPLTRVAKKLLTAWVTGKYGKKMKLSGRNQDFISKRSEHIARYCPREFARRPRSLADYKDYKATEGRQLILYTGPVALQGVMEKQGYMHFLLLHAAIRALCHSPTSQTLLLFAKLALDNFGHPSRQIVRPRKYKTTSLSDIDKVVRRKNKCDLDQTVDIENDINQIRSRLNVNKENEAANIDIQCASASTNNNYSDQLINPLEDINPLNVAGHFERRFVPQKTYTDLLPLRSTADLNENSVPNTSFNGSSISRNETCHHQVTSTLTSTQTGQAIYGLSQQSPCITTSMSLQTGQGIYGFSQQSPCVTTISSQTDQAIYGLSQQSPCVTTISSQTGQTIYGLSQQSPYVTTSINQQENPTQLIPAHSNKSGHSNDRLQDKEISLHEKLSNVVSKEEFQCLRNELNTYHL
ncbi:PREDICTED: uncharacterized protein LOC105556865 [Vollenhovia emeryi]|uniref:uncharacterized protein LOC105556865 n=1 Tax=Vollenhovia emeryi TaxID=411798 RepID=UPI0005F46EEF|nr:PREDICTED: uncharacterized protein LOC105556865 [Vollenhovia emeryi]